MERMCLFKELQNMANCEDLLHSLGQISQITFTDCNFNHKLAFLFLVGININFDKAKTPTRFVV